MPSSHAPILPPQLDALALPSAVLETLVAADASACESLHFTNARDLVAARQAVAARRAALEMHLFRARVAEAFLESRLSTNASGPQECTALGVAAHVSADGEMVQPPATAPLEELHTNAATGCRLGGCGAGFARGLGRSLRNALLGTIPELAALCESLHSIIARPSSGLPCLAASSRCSRTKRSALVGYMASRPCATVDPGMGRLRRRAAVAGFRRSLSFDGRWLFFLGGPQRRSSRFFPGDTSCEPLPVMTASLVWLKRFLDSRTSMRRPLSRGPALSECLQGTLLLSVPPTRRVGPCDAMDFARGLAPLSGLEFSGCYHPLVAHHGVSTACRSFSRRCSGLRRGVAS